MRIRLENISIDFDDKPLIKDLSVEFPSGKLSCLLGSSGSGKTTILKIIAGVSGKFRGNLYYDDDLANNIPIRNRGIGWVPQQQLLFPGLNVFENVAYGLRAAKISESEIIKRVKEVGEMVGISHLLNRSTERLSGGEQQRVAIARALAPEPQILLLDEPFSSLDAPERDKLALIVRGIQLDTQVTMIHVTHSPREADLLADRVYVLSEGEISASGDMNDIVNNPINSKVASLVGVPNVIVNWQEMGSVIIPPDAIELDPNGSFQAILLSRLRNRMVIKIEDFHLEMNLVSTAKNEFNVNIDSDKIISLKS